MTSDDLFWQLVGACRSVDDAALLWWLARVGAHTQPYQEPPRALERIFGLDRVTVLRSRRRLEAAGVVSVRVAPSRGTEYGLHRVAVAALVRSVSGHSVMVTTCCAPLQIDPMGCGSSAMPLDAAPATMWSRVALLLRDREAVLVLAMLHAAMSNHPALRQSSRQIGDMLGGLVDRRTAMRSVRRLQDHGLVDVAAEGRAGTVYRIHQEALAQLVHASPVWQDAVGAAPGWSNLTFPLLDQLQSELQGTGATAAAAAMETA